MNRTDRRYPPIVCTPWCIDAGGHTDDNPLDQRCQTDYLDVPRSLSPKWRDIGGGWNEQITQVYAVSGPEYRPQVFIYDHGSHDIEIRLTAAEARTLARHLLRCADLLESSD